MSLGRFSRRLGVASARLPLLRIRSGHMDFVFMVFGIISVGCIAYSMDWRLSR